jgi:hypothetical protein
MFSECESSLPLVKIKAFIIVFNPVNIKYMVPQQAAYHIKPDAYILLMMNALYIIDDL